MYADRYLKHVAAFPVDLLDLDGPAAFDGIYAAHHHRQPGSVRLLGTYDALTGRNKQRLFAWLRRHGMVPRTLPTDAWEAHHVVEATHYADIDFRGRLQHAGGSHAESAFYLRELPCVLIDAEEHGAYTRLFRTSATRLLYREHAGTGGTLERSLRARRRGRAADQRDALARQIDLLAQCYADTYAGDPVLSRVAANVFAEARAWLRA
jgi:hypothetical protein